MPIKIDNIEIDPKNEEFFRAVELVNSSEKIIYLTGKAGSGKTTFLKYIKKITKKNTVVLAPTGVAALNAGGQTIHSFFRIAPSVYTPNDYRLRTSFNPEDEDKQTIFDNFRYRKGTKQILNELELLIIDEVSMVRCDLIDVVDKLLRVFREKENEPFGGVQVLLIGDAFQLPPIVKSDQWDILKEYYKTPFFFDSIVLSQNRPYYIELNKIYRQNDIKFIELLNKIRTNQVDDEDMKLLNSRFIPLIVKNENLDIVVVATHNRIVDNINNKKLDELNSELITYNADITGDFPDSILPTDRELKLKVGSQVMFIRNDPVKKYYNGKIGKIIKFEKNKIIIEISKGNFVELKRYTWNNIVYSWDSKNKKIEETSIGDFSQFPIKLAWSVTVHKCQGLTFDNIIADITDSFSPGQVYVALSRCKSLEGLYLKSIIRRNAIKTDPNVISFSKFHLLK